MSNHNEYIIHLWNSGTRLKQAVKHALTKGISKDAVVSGYKAISRKYGYSKSVPIERSARMPYAKDWTNLYGTILYSESLNRWYDVKNNRTYDYTSARHNGIIGGWQGA